MYTTSLTTDLSKRRQNSATGSGQNKKGVMEEINT